MRPRVTSHLLTCATLTWLLLGCSKQSGPLPDHPRLTTNVTMRDVAFRSAALDRDMQYRVVLPATIVPGRKLPAVYLLHGGGADFHSWTNDSDVSRFAEKGLVLVMPEGNSSYYVNASERPQGRFEDYIVNDLIADAESKFPIAVDRDHRAVIGGLHGRLRCDQSVTQASRSVCLCWCT